MSAAPSSAALRPATPAAVAGVVVPGVAALPETDRRTWGMGAAVALLLHGAVIAAVVATVVPSEPPVPEPVVLVELPAEAAPAPAVAAAEPTVQPQPEIVQPRTPTPPMDVPPVRTPLPNDAVTLPPPAPAQPRPRAAPIPAAAPAVANPVAVAAQGTGSGASTTPGNDPKARAQEADYFSLVSAHLNRKKRYPVEAKKARQQGVVTIRFTVDRSGNVSGVSIKRTSGHDLLDQATLDLLQRVAPLPRMPASMQRDSVTLSLPIEYSLKTA